MYTSVELEAYVTCSKWVCYLQKTAETNKIERDFIKLSFKYSHAKRLRESLTLLPVIGIIVFQRKRALTRDIRVMFILFKACIN